MPVPEYELKSRTCIVAEEEFHIESPSESAQITGSTYAVLHCKDPYADIKAAYHWLRGYMLISWRTPV